MMAATEIDPAHPREIVPVQPFETGKNPFQHIGILLAERMEMQPVNASQIGTFKILGSKAEP